MKRWFYFLQLLLAASALAYAPERKSFLHPDAVNRLTNTITPLGRQTAQTYNNRGLLATVKEPSGDTTTLTHDPRGRLTNRTDSLGTVIFRYDANNNLTNIVENGKTNTWTFDAYDRATSYRDADDNLLQYRYDASGNLTNLVYPDGRAVRYAYDSMNRLTNVTDWANRQTSIEYDLASRVRKITRPNGTVREVNYDAGQTTNIVERLTNNAPIAFFKLNWDNAGRVAWEFAAPLPHSNAPPVRTMYFDADNRLLTFNGSCVTNDLDGNLTSGPGTSSTFVSYGYNARNQLTNAAGISYGYDPAGNRTALTNGANVTRFVVNPNAPLSQVLMRVKGGVTNYYVHGLGLLYEVTETASSTNMLAYHHDYRGSTVALTDGNGIPTDRVEYSAYGSLTYRSGTNDTPFLFNGRYGVQTDPNGLLYMRARYYNPFLCRFINQDPSGFSGGLNFYAYADGNPISLIDPFGLGVMAPDFSWLQTQKWWDQQMAPLRGTTSMSYPQSASAMLNMLPVLGGLKMAGEAMWGSDFVTGQRIENTTAHAAWAVANIGITAMGAVEAGAARTSVAALPTTARAAPEAAWPANRGFMAGEGDQASVLPGQVLDRYGGTGGNFLAPAGTPAAARSLAPGVELRPITSYQVLQPFQAGAGRAAPWFNQPGGGLQFDLRTRTVQDLINSGHLKPLP